MRLEDMNSYLTHSLVSDHIRQSRQQAAAARQASAARGARRRIRTHVRLPRGA